MSRRLSRFQLSEVSLSPQDGGLAMQRGLTRASHDDATAIAGPQPPQAFAPFSNSITLADLGGDGVSIFGPPSGGTGIAAAGGGDFNGDGIDDIVVSTTEGGGAIYVIFGQDGGGASGVFLSALQPSEGFRIIADNSWDAAGRSVALGDVNNDGYDDLLVGAANVGVNTNSAAGAAYVIFGKASGFGTIDLGSLAPADGFRLQEDASNNRVGNSVAFADVNDDGFSDMIVGAPDLGNIGAVFVVFGKATGFGNVDLTNLSAADGIKITGVANSLTGESVDSAGDVNGDGIEDFIIGALGADIPQVNAGAAWVIFGKTTGLVSFDLATLSAADGFKIQGLANSSLVGDEVSSAGDINDDGYDDLIVGSATSRGAVYIVYGKASGFGTIDLATLAPADGFVITGPASGARLGFSVDGVGDVNGDGIDDLLLGAPDPSTGFPWGNAYLIYGRTTGFSNIDLSRAFVAADGLILAGDNRTQSPGDSVRAAGDFNHDGIMDFIVTDATAHDGPGGATGAAYVIYGRAGDPVPPPIFGTANADALIGTSGVDDIRGLGGNDYLEGLGSPDRLAGGQGNDTYAVEDNSDLVVELAGEGNDTVYTFTDYVLPAGQSIEVLSARDVSSTSLLNLTGNELANTLIGNNGKNILDGGGGGDGLYGLGGDDIYRPRSASDQVFEGAGGGQDIVYVNFSYQLVTGQSVETLVIENFQSIFAADLIGNELNNNIGGNAAANAIYGGAGDDGLFGYAGDDYLNGGTGIDYYEGGTGNDTFIVDNSAEIVRENVADQGSDRIFTSASYTIETNSSVELLAAIDNTATSALQLTGNNLANTILGNNGDNVLSGMESADIIGGYDGDDMIDGGSGADYLEGGGGSDVIEGGTGADYMNGGTGDDTYYVDNAGDQAVEQPGEGNDIVYASISFALAAGASIETLAGRDAAATTALTLGGNDGDNVVTGNAGANSLLGNSGADTLNGLGGNDFLDGGTGSDIMVGGAGNDTFVVDAAGDVVTEAVGGGSDLVYVSASYTLAAGQEIEVLAARDSSQTTAFTLTGNEFANTILGNNGDNLIDGKAGNDTLQGYGGADTFAFTTALGANNIDWIFGFSAVDDTIALDHNAFAGLNAGALPAGAFAIGSAAADADDRIIYNAATGDLFFDADGNASGAAVLFAHLESAPTISASDFVVI